CRRAKNSAASEELGDAQHDWLRQRADILSYVTISSAYRIRCDIFFVLGLPWLRGPILSLDLQERLRARFVMGAPRRPVSRRSSRRAAL
uniref:hypothetical protein n=1 Tax=Cellulosimicrobium sp. TH-20 TaxID=1980001 RepID=UPI001C999733